MESSFLEIFKPQPHKATGNLLCLTQELAWKTSRGPFQPEPFCDLPPSAPASQAQAENEQKPGSGELGAALDPLESSPVQIHED